MSNVDHTLGEITAIVLTIADARGLIALADVAVNETRRSAAIRDAFQLLDDASERLKVLEASRVLRRRCAALRQSINDVGLQVAQRAIADSQPAADNVVRVDFSHRDFKPANDVTAGASA